MHHNWQVSFEPTPNPATMKFVVAGGPLSTATHDFADAAAAFDSPLAYKIFGFPWAAGVFIGSDFVTVTKQDWVDWDILAQPLADLIQEHLERGEPIITERSREVQAEAGILDSDTDDVKAIKRVLFEEIKPTVAMDGGDVSFNRYEDGVVYINMKGSCAGCPSSSATLKQGIEIRLKEAVPSIMGVVGV